MRITTLRRRSSAAAHGVLALLAAACGTGPDLVDLGGTWQGTTLLPDAYATTLTLVQSGSAISGTISIDGQLGGSVTGSFNDMSRVLTWTAFEGCERWSGTLTANADGNQMSGPVLVDLGDCSPAGTNASGTISLTKS